MKKTAVWLAVATVVAALPFGVVWLVQGDSGMAAVMLLFYLADPVFSLILGTAAGREIKKALVLAPVFPAFVFAGSRGGVYLQRVDLLRLRSGVSDFGVSCHRGDVVDRAEERIKILLVV